MFRLGRALNSDVNETIQECSNRQVLVALSLCVHFMIKICFNVFLFFHLHPLQYKQKRAENKKICEESILLLKYCCNLTRAWLIDKLTELSAVGRKFGVIKMFK